MKYLYFFVLFFPLTMIAQPANNSCAEAFRLPEQPTYCSGTGRFSNVAATSTLPVNDYPVCIDERAQIRDVWFAFTALRNSVNIQVRGNVEGNPGGSLAAPQFALFAGTCTGLSAIGCRSPFQNPQTGQFLNGGNLIFNQLVVGQTYFIMVGARNGNAGTFELCVDQFDAVPEPSSDCATGVVLCDKSSFSVPFLQGSGRVNDNLLSENINCSSPIGEFNSAWYKWTCDQPGSLDFTITPLGAALNEDIDFVLFELPSGLDNCNDKRVLRQMFSGETSGQGAANLPCLGPTGLRSGEGGILENCGCDQGDNNFVSAIDMVSGRSYALVVMNFSGSGDGFSIEFGGRGTFLGPAPAFTVTIGEVCVGEALVFTDQSQSVDPIVRREWDFGETASPRTATGPGPHSVVFREPGTPSVSLLIETSRTCREIVSQQEVTVRCCAGQFSGTFMATDVRCPADSNGRIDFSGSSNFSPATTTYNWSNGATTEDIDGLTQGTYTLTLSDVSGCTEVFTAAVGGPAPFTFDTLIQMPDCAGGTNGQLTFTVTGGGQSPYTYRFNGGAFGPENQRDNLPVGVVAVEAQDANGCRVAQDIAVNELALELVAGAPLVTEPICAGEASGTITINLANGTPDFTYDFGLGEGFERRNQREELPAGRYQVVARDAEGCLGNFSVEVPDPPTLQIENEGNDISCFGEQDGNITLRVSGGRPGYTYRWSDGATTDSVRTALSAGPYTVSLTDRNGCLRSLSDTIIEPAEVLPVLEVATDLVCFEEPTGSFLLSASGGTPGYTYSADGINFQNDPLLSGLLAGDYQLFVQDANGCRDSLTSSLGQPVALVVNPGTDLRIVLGFDTTLQATSNFPATRFVWGPDSLRCLDPLCTRVRAAPVRTTDYSVIGINSAGCMDTAQVRLAVIEDRPLFIPSAFSPNGDGINDLFTVFGGRAVEQVNFLRVYNRWGGLVFERENFEPGTPALGWDGTVEGRPANPAVFVYQAAVRFIDGTTVAFTGDLSLIR